MIIPDYFKKKITIVFEDKGEKWLADLPEIFEKCIDKWDLTDLKISQDLSFNYVCFAKSPEFGDVALKIGVPYPELYTEMEALTLYNGGDICLCYDLDRELGALLLERILPGGDLNTVEDQTTKVEIAAELMANLPIEIEENEKLPSYSDWIERGFKTARMKREEMGEELLTLVDRAEKLYQKILAQGGSKALLHGDLHHKNILQDQEGNWRAIDPKGVVGLPCMDTARFIENHIELVEDEEGSLTEMIQIISNKVGETERTIASALVVDAVLSTVWQVEDNADPEDMPYYIGKCQFFLNHLNQLDG